MDFIAVDMVDACFGVRVVGLDGDLPAGVAFRIHADVFQGHSQKADGYLFAGGQHHIHFARVGEFLHLMRQCHQAVGFAAHGRYHDHYVVAFGAGLGDTFGHILDALGGAYRSAAVFLYD